MVSAVDVPSIKEFFSGKTVFITGGTGFVGRVLIEKLLRSCSGVQKIYVLLRPKKGKNIVERLKDIYDNELFEKYMSVCSDEFFEKVIPIAGDIQELNLGISEEDRRTLEENVEILFHSAASVRFNDSLSKNVILNTRGTRDVLTLAENMKKLLVLLHVSTAYTNTDRNPVTEEVFPPHADWRNTIKMAESTDNYTLKLLTPKYINPLPNTYVFTKNLAEHVMNEKKGIMPIVIFRPSVVISSLFDPIPGWIDNFNGPLGMTVAAGKGFLRVVYLDRDLPLSNVPVDIVVRSMIVAAWQRGIRKMSPDDDIPVIHCCDAGLNITFGHFSELGLDLVNEVPLNNMIWVPKCSMTTNRFIYYVQVLFMHLLPSLFLDSLLKITGNEPMLIKIHRKIYGLSSILEFYAVNYWKFVNKRFISMCDLIPTHEKADFHYIFSDLNVNKYIKDSFLGGRRYLLKEADDTLDHARRHYQRIKVMTKVIRILFFGIMCWIILKSSLYQSFKIGMSRMVYNI